MSLKNSNYIIGNRTRDLPVCSVEPYSLLHCVLPFVLWSGLYSWKNMFFFFNYFLCQGKFPFVFLSLVNYESKMFSKFRQHTKPDVLPSFWLALWVCNSSGKFIFLRIRYTSWSILQNILLACSCLLLAFRKIAGSDCLLHVCPSVRMHRLGSHWKDFHEI
jgi:hypothetical protein